MDETLVYFTRDLFDYYMENFRNSSVQKLGETAEDRAYRLGKQIAYFHCLNILESHLLVFGISLQELGVKSPELAGDRQDQS